MNKTDKFAIFGIKGIPLSIPELHQDVLPRTFPDSETLTLKSVVA